MKTNKELIRSVIDRVLWTANATEYNRNLLAEAIDEAIALSQRSVLSNEGCEAVPYAWEFEYLDSDGWKKTIETTHPLDANYGTWKTVPERIRCIEPLCKSTPSAAAGEQVNFMLKSANCSEIVSRFYIPNTPEYIKNRANTNCQKFRDARLKAFSSEYEAARQACAGIALSSAIEDRKVPAADGGQGTIHPIQNLTLREYLSSQGHLEPFESSDWLAKKFMKFAKWYPEFPTSDTSYCRDGDEYLAWGAKHLIDFFDMGFSVGVEKAKNHYKYSTQPNNSAQPTPAQGDAVPVASKFGRFNGWEYCPECGCLESSLPAEDDRTVCVSCGQEWYTSIDYSGVVRRNLERLAATRQSSADAVDAAVYRWWKKERPVSLLTSYYGNGCINKTIEGMEEEIRSAIAAQGGKGE